MYNVAYTIHNEEKEKKNRNKPIKKTLENVVNDLWLH